MSEVVDVDTVKPRDAGEQGLSRSGFYRASRSGRYDRIARGIYRPADTSEADWDRLEAASRRKDATICLVSALAHHDLTDSIPSVLDVAIPRGSRRPAGSSAIAWHHFARETFSLGRGEIEIPGTSMRMGLYSVERSIADAFRLRGYLGYELGRDALREWLRRGGKPADLMTVAGQLPRTRGPLLQALEMMT